MNNAGGKLLIVDFFATWCTPCESIIPFLETFAETYGNKIEIIKVDVNELKDLAIRKYHISSLPSFVFLKHGEKVEQIAGAAPDKIKETIEKLISS